MVLLVSTLTPATDLRIIPPAVMFTSEVNLLLRNQREMLDFLKTQYDLFQDKTKDFQRFQRGHFANFIHTKTK
jgi:hypothetical protein